MITYVFLLLISYFLEGIVPNILSNIVLFFMISAILIGSILNIDKKNYFFISIIFSLLYDITYTSFAFMNTLIFIFFMIIYKKINVKNFFLLIIEYIISIMFYFLINYIITFELLNINYNYLLKTIFNSMIFNITYFIILYSIVSLVKLIKRNIISKKA